MKNNPRYIPLFFTLIFFLLPHLNLSSSLTPRRCYPDDERALLELKAHFGQNLSAFSTWTTKTDCCDEWLGIACKKIPKTTVRRVNFLELNGYDDIVGTIPSSLDKLPYLESLILRLLPNLTGPIPPVIGKLTNLQYLSLNWDSLSGPIPQFLGQLTNLVTLSLNDNHFTGTIPSFLGRLPNLKAIDLYDNQLTGPLPANLFGPFRSNQSPVFLALNNNKLSGQIPRSLGGLNFEILNLSGNQFAGDASFLFGEDKTALAHLILADNRLSFDFSKVVMPVGELNSSLLVLDVSRNDIYGSLPAWVGQAPVMYEFNVSYNRLCGPIPTPTGRWERPFAESAFAHNLCLCGPPLPPCKQ